MEGWPASLPNSLSSQGVASTNQPQPAASASIHTVAPEARPSRSPPRSATMTGAERSASSCAGVSPAASQRAMASATRGCSSADVSGGGEGPAGGASAARRGLPDGPIATRRMASATTVPLAWSLSSTRSRPSAPTGYVPRIDQSELSRVCWRLAGGGGASLAVEVGVGQHERTLALHFAGGRQQVATAGHEAQGAALRQVAVLPGGQDG